MNSCIAPAAPFSNRNLAYPYWKCFEVSKAKINCDNSGYIPGSKEENALFTITIQDSESEHLVQEALEKLMVGRTSIVIAHRLATIRNADKIVVLQKGEVLETGNHAQLIKHEEGLYYKLSKMQFELA